MKFELPYAPIDILMIKWHLLATLLCLAIAAAIYLTVGGMSQQSQRDLRGAQGELSQAQSSVELIEVEDATIREYLDRYRELSAQKVVEAEDRLQFLERMAEIRSEFSLFPISVNIDEQSSHRLTYDPSVRDPAGPVDLRFSNIQVSLPLLHEDDLTRLLTALDTSPGLYQVQSCSLTLRNRAATSFVSLGQHFQAACSLVRYSFDLSPQS